MANPLKQLAGQTAIYGLSSIVARLLNYLLTPLYTSKNVFDPEQYGIITEMYAYVAFLIIFLTYGMETAFFRFASKDPSRKQLIFSTAARSLVTTSAIFMTMATLFSEEIGRALHYPDHTEYVIWFAIIVGLDAIGTLPLARLREENKAYRFAFINLANVGINIGLNLFFLAYCLPKTLAGESNWLIETFYDPEIGVGYVFIANLIASIVKFLLLSPYIIMSKGFDKAILKNMLRYSLPLLVVGIGWYINENFDRILLKFLLFEEKGEVATMQEVGVYGANYKLSIIIMLFIQAFRYAADPFYFGRQGEKGARELYASIMNFFVLTVCSIFLLVTLFLDLFKYFIPNEAYWVGLSIVPILLMANIFQGIYYNLSFWYKFIDKTSYGALLGLLGAAITLILNFIFIPSFGYKACAWVTFTAYGTIMLLSYFIGQRNYPIPYQIGKLCFYMLFALGIFIVYSTLKESMGSAKFLVSFAGLAIFILVGILMERKNIRLLQQNT
ncbi:MAG: oligosaccharide flippase family protein [Flavobacteriales bacterium]|nr:oligosaccharide flippase family protein [Flavobacteriales bacterium]